MQESRCSRTRKVGASEFGEIAAITSKQRRQPSAAVISCASAKAKFSFLSESLAVNDDTPMRGRSGPQPNAVERRRSVASPNSSPMPGNPGRAGGDWLLAGRFCCLPTAWSIDWDGLPARSACRRGVNRTSLSPLGNARQTQAFQVVLPVFVPFEWISPAEVFDREARLQAQQFLDVGPGLLAPAQVPERCDQRPVAGDELRVRPGAAPPNDHGAFVVALEGVSEGVEVLEPRGIGVERGKLLVTFQPLEGNFRLADVAEGGRAERPTKDRKSVV